MEVTFVPGTMGSSPQNQKIFDLETFMTSFQLGQYVIDSETKTIVDVWDEYTATIRGSIRFRRDTADFWFKVFMPDCLLHAAIFVSFFMTAPPARVTLCIIAALSFRIMMSSLYAELPAVSYSIWCGADLIFVSFCHAEQRWLHVATLQTKLVSFSDSPSTGWSILWPSRKFLLCLPSLNTAGLRTCRVSRNIGKVTTRA